MLNYLILGSVELIDKDTMIWYNEFRNDNVFSEKELIYLKKVIIAGSRGFQDYSFLKRTLNKHILEPVIVVSGCAAGADKMGEQWAAEYGLTVEQHPANWKNLDAPVCVVRHNKYGAYNAMAGHNRNREMLDSIRNNPDGGFVIAFWDGKSKGTENMIKIAREAGIQVIIAEI